MPRIYQDKFNAGIWSPLLDGRSELEKYRSACTQLENFLVWPHGAAQFRPGFKFIHPTRQNQIARLIPFEFSITETYQIELTDQKLRFYRNKAIITLTAQNITNITQANPAVVTYSGSDTYANGDPIIISSVSGMVELNNREFTVANVNVGANTFELSGIDSSGYTAYSSGGTVSEIYEIDSPFVEADLGEVDYSQTGDLLYLAHEDYATRKLTRTADTAWTLSTVNFRPGPTTEAGVEPNTTLTLGAVTGTGITFTAGAATFLNGDVGRIISSGTGRASITSFSSTTQVVVDIIDDFVAVGPIASGSWTMEGSPDDTLTPSRKQPVGSIVTLTTTSLNCFRSTHVGKFIRINNGFVKITSYTSATEIKGEILKELSATTGTTNWTLEESVWSAGNGYPAAVTFFEERLILAGSTEFPETVWGSVIGDYENFTPGVDDSDSFTYTLAGRDINKIQWLEPSDVLIIGTSGTEWRLGTEESKTALTPLNAIARPISTSGSAKIKPLVVGNALLFVQRAQRKLVELSYDALIASQGGYKAPDLTILAEHLTAGLIGGIAYQKNPFSTVWAYLDDGDLLGLTYLRAEDVLAWQKVTLGGSGSVISVSTNYGSPYDELWVVVERTIDGSTVRYVEVMEDIFTDDDDTFQANNGSNAFHVDSGLTYNGTATTTVSGLSHLEGETVKVVGDGALQLDKTVSDGIITVTSASVVHVGLSYTGTLQPLKVDATLRDGTTQGLFSRIREIIAKVNNSLHFKIGRDSSNLDVVYDREYIPTIGSTPPLFTGDIRFGYDAGFNRNHKPLIVQDKPLPLTVTGLVYDIEFN